VLEALGGVVWLLAGAGMTMLGALIPQAGMELPMFLAALADLMGAVFLIFGIIAFVLAYGLFTGKGWAWLWSLVLAVIGVILAIFEARVVPIIVPLIINLIIIYYLTRPHVKAFFGR
jgi:uncharacterized membrane protein (DUF2068 family)